MNNRLLPQETMGNCQGVLFELCPEALYPMTMIDYDNCVKEEA